MDIYMSPLRWRPIAAAARCGGGPLWRAVHCERQKWVFGGWHIIWNSYIISYWFIGTDQRPCSPHHTSVPQATPQHNALLIVINGTCILMKHVHFSNIHGHILAAGLSLLTACITPIRIYIISALFNRTRLSSTNPYAVVIQANLIQANLIQACLIQANLFPST